MLRLPVMLTATEAPMPTLPPLAPLSTGAALAVMSVLFSAASATAPAPASTAAPLRTTASLRVSIRFSASEPAIPTLLPPAPDAASVCMVWVLSPATSVIPAFSESPLEWTTALPPTIASATEVTLLTDTAAPMPTCVVLPSVLPSASACGNALPSAVTLASVLFDAASVRAPADVTLTGTSARAVAFCRFTPTAAATEILPSLVLAEPSPFFCACTAPPVEACCLLSPTLLAVCLFLPRASCLPILSSTLASSPLPVPPAAPASSAWWPPLALAVADTSLADAPWALKVTEPLPAPDVPFATIARAVVVSTKSSTNATATAAPIAALPPTALPLAVVVVLVDCAACSSRSPFKVSGRLLLVPRLACVVLFTIEIAADGVIEIPPAEPASVSVCTACVLPASSARSRAPCSCAPSANWASVRVPTTFTATEAPIPTLSPVAPPAAGVALAVLSLALRAVNATSPAAPTRVTTAPPRSAAVVALLMAFTTNEPATPTPLAPAPETAVVVKLFTGAVVSIKAFADTLPASSVWATAASLLNWARLMATAAATPVALFVALLSAPTTTVLPSSLRRSTAPATLAGWLDASSTCVWLLRSLTATAPATLIPSPGALSAVLALSLYLSSVWLLWLAPLSSFSAPWLAALAVTIAVLREAAARSSAPAVITAWPSTTAEVVLSITLTATAAPAALPPAAAASAIDVVLTVLAAARPSFPVTVAVVVPVTRTCATLVTSDTATAASPALLASAEVGVALVLTLVVAPSCASPATVNVLLPPTLTVARASTRCTLAAIGVVKVEVLTVVVACAVKFSVVRSWLDWTSMVAAASALTMPLVTASEASFKVDVADRLMLVASICAPSRLIAALPPWVCVATILMRPSCSTMPVATDRPLVFTTSLKSGAEPTKRAPL